MRVRQLRLAATVTHMRQDHDLVLGEVDVRFDGVRADVDGGTECAERVFRICRLVASVGDGYGKLNIIVRPRLLGQRRSEGCWDRVSAL